jgi:signal transduction histidine kinase
MQSVQEVTGQEAATKHERFLSSVSRHLISLDLDPMLEAVAHAALPLFGDLCVIDRSAGMAALRLLEVRNGAEARIDPPEALVAVARAEIRIEGERSRLTVPIVVGAERFGSLSFVGGVGTHGAPELALAQELAERLGLAIANIKTHTQLREAVADREKLISVAAHELRGPVCSVRLCIQALKRMERSSPSKGGRLLEIMDREERRLARLIDELLDLTRLRSGQFELDLEPVDMCDVVREVASRMTMDASRAGSELEVRADRPLVGRWDRSRLDQVVTNLLANAIKFGQRRPIAISVEADADGASARLVVTDHGLGIDPEIQQRIFEPFKRAVVGRRYEGLGLGLYIVRNIVGQLGGTVSVSSAPGCGSTFTVELPIEAETFERASATS